MAFWQKKGGERAEMDRLIRQNPGVRPAELVRALRLVDQRSQAS